MAATSSGSLSDYLGSFFGQDNTNPTAARGGTTNGSQPSQQMDLTGGTSSAQSAPGSQSPFAPSNPSSPQQYSTPQLPSPWSSALYNPSTATMSPNATTPNATPFGSGMTIGANGQITQTPSGSSSGSSASALFNGMDPRLVSLFQQYGVTPTGPGSGNSDIAYWNSKIASDPGNAQYYLNRIAADFSGQGSDTNSGYSGTGFGDPAYNLLNQLAMGRINDLGNPANFPQLNTLISQLTQNQADAKARAQTFADQLTQRIGQLQQPLLTTANVAQQQALASNNLLAARDAALKNAADQRYAAGFAPTSGLLDNDQRAINQNYSNQQGNINAQLQEQQIQGDEQRRNEATQLQGLVQQALQGGDVTALGEQAQVADLENQVYNINQQRANQQLLTGQIPVDLTNQGFANANNAANSGTNPLSSIFSLLSLGQQQQGLQQNQQNSNMSALAWMLQQALR